jgi:hypothetical protein
MSAGDQGHRETSSSIWVRYGFQHQRSARLSDESGAVAVLQLEKVSTKKKG